MRNYAYAARYGTVWEIYIYTVQDERLISLEVLVGFRVTRLLGHGPPLLLGLCPLRVLGGGGRACFLEHT